MEGSKRHVAYSGAKPVAIVLERCQGSVMVNGWLVASLVADPWRVDDWLCLVHCYILFQRA